MGSVGVIVNPWAGKDVRRLHAPVGHTPDTAKTGIVRRIAIAALEAGADRVHAAHDTGSIAERAIAGLAGCTLAHGPGTGSALDTRRAAAQFAELGCDVVVVLGGDGTCRDVAIGWPDAALIPLSTGTNNVFPVFCDATSAGTAAGLVAAGHVDATRVGTRAKLLTVDVVDPGRDPARPAERDVALVDVALLDEARTGARAVVRAGAIRVVVAAIATPASTGLSNIAGRALPLGPADDGAVTVHLGGASRALRVPIVPGSFDTLWIDRVAMLEEGQSLRLDGPGVLAYDGERDRVLPEGASAEVSVSRGGPTVIDVERALRCAAGQRLFDAPRERHAVGASTAPAPEAHDGH